MNHLDLIEQAQKGDRNSFSELVALYQNSLYKYLLAKCGNEDDAADILQESFFSAYKYIQSYNPKWSFATWLFTIASRKSNTFSKPYLREEPLAENSQSYEIEDCFQDPRNIWNQVRLTVKRTSFDVLWFYYVEERNCKDIAKIMSKSQAWVRMNLHRSKKKLFANPSIRKISKEYLMTGVLL